MFECFCSVQLMPCDRPCECIFVGRCQGALCLKSQTSRLDLGCGSFSETKNLTVERPVA